MRRVFGVSFGGKVGCYRRDGWCCSRRSLSVTMAGMCVAGKQPKGLADQRRYDLRLVCWATKDWLTSGTRTCAGFVGQPKDWLTSVNRTCAGFVGQPKDWLTSVNRTCAGFGRQPRDGPTKSTRTCRPDFDHSKSTGRPSASRTYTWE